MNWYSIGLSVLSGAIAALIATLICGKDQENKSARGAIFVFIFLALMAGSRTVGLPKINAYRAKADVAHVLTTVPAFVSMSKYAPDTYSRLSKTMTDAIEKGVPPQEALGQVKAQMQAFVASRLADASDEALLGYSKVMVTEMGELQNKGNGLCYQFLFPQAGSGVNVAAKVSEETQAADLAALNELIKTSNTKRPVPSASEVMPILQPLIIEMSGVHGTSMSILDNPMAPGVDKEKVCSISRDLYQRILALPPERAALALRFMFSQK